MGVEGQQLQQHRVQSLQRQKTDALAIVQWLEKTLGKCQFVVDTMLFSNILRHGFLLGSSPGGSREFEAGTASARIRKQLLN